MSKPSTLIREQLAKGTLDACNIPRGADFHTLSSNQVECLLAWAGAVNYREPKNANGSRARYFHDMLQRRAAAKKGS